MRSIVAVLCVACGSTGNAQPVPAEQPATSPGATTPPVAAPAPRPVPKLGDPASTARVVDARVAAAVDDGPASERPAYARADQKVTLYAVIVAEVDRKRTFYSDAPALRLGGKPVATKPLAAAPQLELHWNKIEPAVATMSNGEQSTFHFEPIDYRATPIEAAGGRGSITADVHPTLTPDHGNGVGTMRYQIVALQGDRSIASAGPEARRGRGSGGVTDAVLRISIRRDDTYLGYLTEMYGQPYIWASAGITDATHQSELLEGSDCADFVVYGARRQGKRIAYTWTGGLPDVSTLLAAGARGDDGVYRDKNGKPLPFTRVGDMILFTRHVGVLTVDRGELGVLDDKDIIMHSLHDSPKEQPIADTGYADTPVELRRLR
jgi:hypothetical protein